MVQRRVLWLALVLAAASLLQSPGCSSSHPESSAADAGSSIDAGSPPPAEPTRVVRDDLPCPIDLPPGMAESDSCPPTSPDPFGECELPDGAACLYGATHAGGLPVVVIASCNPEAAGRWSIDSGACMRDCAPGPSGEAIEFDVSECGSREVAPCVDGLTEQARLDATLDAMLTQNGFERFEINEGRLYLELEQGCPRRLYGSWGRALASAGELADVLSLLRLSCALELTCAEVEGPSTLGAQ